MFKRSLVAIGLLVADMSTASAIPYGLSDARSVAMGNVSIATGGVTTAAFSNPAMLMINESDDAFALHLGAGAAFIEDGSVTDDIDRFQQLEDQLALIDTSDVNNSSQLLDLLNQQIQVINDLNGDSLVGRVSPNFGLIYGGDSFAIAFTAEANGYASGGIYNMSGISPLTEQQIIDDINNTGTLTFNPDADLVAIGAITTEVGVSIATDFDIAGINIALGVRPKTVSAEAVVYNQTLSLASEADIFDDTSQDLGSFSTMDAGVVIGFSESFRVGITARNLMSETLTVTTNGTSHDINFDTHVRAGIAYQNSFMTVAADMDLTETDPILIEDPSKMLALGIELNALDFMQVRAGYQTNTASGATADDLISAGVGLWLGFNLDIAAVVSEDSVGAFIQTGFRF